MVVLSKRHWLVGALTALVVYTSITLAVLWRMPTSAQSARVGEGGIVIGLGPAEGSPGQVQATSKIEEPVEALAKLADPAYYLAQHQGDLVILDEIHQVPELFDDVAA